MPEKRNPKIQRQQAWQRANFSGDTSGAGREGQGPRQTCEASGKVLNRIMGFLSFCTGRVDSAKPDLKGLGLGLCWRQVLAMK